MTINDEQQQQQHQWCEVDGDSVINQLRIWKLIVEGIQPPRHVLKRVIEQSIPVMVVLYTIRCTYLAVKGQLQGWCWSFRPLLNHAPFQIEQFHNRSNVQIVFATFFFSSSLKQKKTFFYLWLVFFIIVVSSQPCRVSNRNGRRWGRRRQVNTAKARIIKCRTMQVIFLNWSIPGLFFL